uniref:Ets DNA-binding protein pokkuri n=1 Tax=Timema douglasi TaxID=61478 RepID=A0A7R8VLB5_TIMDO|nr:unnamed protein product [Timema douglasi]
MRVTKDDTPSPLTLPPMRVNRLRLGCQGNKALLYRVPLQRVYPPPPPLNLSPSLIEQEVSPLFLPEKNCSSTNVSQPPATITRALRSVGPVMKLLPLSLPPVGTMDRLPLSLPFSPSDLLWRYPLGFPAPQQPPPMSPLLDFKTHLPNNLASDPRVWSREDVASFLRWCEREFDLPQFEMEMFQMNGKAMCLLTKSDLGERCPGSGDVLHNVVQLLVRDAQTLQRCLPSSPVTPTSRHHYPLSPHHITSQHPNTPNWGMLTPTATDFQTRSLVHLVHQGNSVTLSPAPSVDSQSGSPQHADQNASSSYHSGGSNGSNQSDSDEDSYQDSAPAHPSSSAGNTGHHATGASPPSTPAPSLPSGPHSPGKDHPTAFRPVAREFFPADTPEPNTNGRLLWDFLQQLLNDPTQRYTNYIAWKNRDTGVFKIVDPAGLAKLWGIQKNHLSMNYDKMSRALRYYYRVNILRKVQGERHCYQFLRNPSELKSIKNMSLLRQQMSPTRPAPSLQAHHTPAAHPGSGMSIKLERDEGEDGRDSPADDDLLPTDLSMSPSARQHIDTRMLLCQAEITHSLIGKINSVDHAKYNVVKVEGADEK